MASNFHDQVAGVVSGILADPTQWPAEMTAALPQVIAQNPVANAYVSGARLALSTNTGNVSTSGSTFAAGADLLPTPLQFSASGGNSYIVRVAAPNWSNNTAGDGCHLRINLDGADGGLFSYMTSSGVSLPEPCVGAGIIVTPASGNHSVNVRLVATSGGTATVGAGAGGAATNGPIIVTLEVA